jgi:5-oxoprolinase (ATP-hydrolysing)
MSESIKTVIERNPQMQPGDVYVLNDPYHGGTHLPDVTVVTPVYLDDATDARPSFYVASRGHHADIGGSTPGSMPPFSTRIDEEGVLFDNFLLVRGGRLREAELLARLHGEAAPGVPANRYPARNPQQTWPTCARRSPPTRRACRSCTRWSRSSAAPRGGLHAARAGQRRGVGAPRDHALKDGQFALPLDNGALVKVRVTVDAAAREALIDFTGTSAQLPNNFNAPKAVTMAAVLYVFRTLVDDDIPLNAGCLKPLQVIVPGAACSTREPPAAVVAGNVETSQCVTNALYGALGVMAAGPCTMNNFTFGNAQHQYYETISAAAAPVRCATPGASPAASTARRWCRRT